MSRINDYVFDKDFDNINTFLASSEILKEEPFLTVNQEANKKAISNVLENIGVSYETYMLFNGFR